MRKGKGLRDESLYDVLQACNSVLLCPLRTTKEKENSMDSHMEATLKSLNA